MFFKKAKTRNRLVKADIESVNLVLEWINASALQTANIGAEHKKRLVLEGSEEDEQVMKVCDAVTQQLKDAYETLYAVITSKEEQLGQKKVQK